MNGLTEKIIGEFAELLFPLRMRKWPELMTTPHVFQLIIGDFAT